MRLFQSGIRGLSLKHPPLYAEIDLEIKISYNQLRDDPDGYQSG